jgi:1-acyl-sn-glycerol-3-phosphate acyltransferase
MAWRILRVVEHLTTGALICVYIALACGLGQRPSWVPAAVCWWHGRLCRALGVRVEVAGTLAERCLLVANHISWLDIPVLGAQAQIGFLSKAEVRGWPLVGWMSEVAGTLFIERGANQTGEIAQRIADGLALGRALAIFPEGTTSRGHEVRRFHPRLFAIAQQPGLGIQPVALAYRRGDDPRPDPSVPFVGEDTLVANLWRIVRHPDLVAQVHFLGPIRGAEGQDRRGLAAASRQSILAALALPDTEPRRPAPGGDRPQAAQAEGWPGSAGAGAATDPQSAPSDLAPAWSGPV